MESTHRRNNSVGQILNERGLTLTSTFGQHLPPSRRLLAYCYLARLYQPLSCARECLSKGGLRGRGLQMPSRRIFA